MMSTDRQHWVKVSVRIHLEVFTGHLKDVPQEAKRIWKYIYDEDKNNTR